MKASDFFCWTVQGPSDLTIEAARQQMQLCGGHIIFANFSNPERHTIKLYEGSMDTGTTPGGWANNTGIFLVAWEYIAKSTWPDQFKWFVKLDADTFLRPRFLPAAVEGLDPSTPVAVAVNGRIRGALEVMSWKTYRDPKSHLIYQREVTNKDPYLKGEDVWLGYAVQKAGFKLVDAPLVNGCISFLLSYFNLPAQFKDEKGVKGTSSVPAAMLMRGDFSKPATHHCVSRNILAMHPVKDVAAYASFLRMDRELRAMPIADVEPTP